MTLVGSLLKKLEKQFLTLEQGLSTYAVLIDILGQMIPVWGRGCPVHCRSLGIISDVYSTKMPVTTPQAPPVMTTKMVSIAIARCPSGKQNHPGLRTTALQIYL